jgi:hypothetical protein
MKRFEWLSQQTKAYFLVFKLFYYVYLGGVKAESTLPQSGILISLVVLSSLPFILTYTFPDTTASLFQLILKKSLVITE